MISWLRPFPSAHAVLSERVPTSLTPDLKGFVVQRGSLSHLRCFLEKGTRQSRRRPREDKDGSGQRSSMECSCVPWDWYHSEHAPGIVSFNLKNRT